MGVSTEVKNPTFSSSPCARDACRSGIAPRKLTTTRQKPQWRPEGITIPKGDFLLLRVSLKTMFKDLLVFCFWSILRSKRFKSFSFGQDLVCAESRHAAAGTTTTTTTMTAVSFLRVSKHLDGRPWRKWSRRLSFRQEVPAPEKGGVASFGGKQRPFSWCPDFLQQFSSSFVGKEGAFQLHLYHS